MSLSRARARKHAKAALLTAGAICALSACGDSADENPRASMWVTRDFGRHTLSSAVDAPLEGHRTALDLLRAHADVKTAFGGLVVSSIDGLALRQARSPDDDERTWTLNVNGIEADEKPSEYRLHPGDVVQWDYRDWYVTLDVRATVGAFPETFTKGVFGARFPVTLECAPQEDRACAIVRRVFARADVRVDGSRPPGRRPPAGQPQRAKILVGTWDNWRDRPWPHRIDTGPRYSGVFARFDRTGDRLRLLDWDARHRRTLGAGTGLIAAQRPTEEDLLWTITGTDRAGVVRAAEALASDELRNAFAAVATADGVVKIPLPPVR